jgi:hypothetical protein
MQWENIMTTEQTPEQITEQQAIDNIYVLKGLPNIHQLTLEDILSKINNMTFHHPEKTTMTICVITLNNGFSITGEHAYVDFKEYDFELGCEHAKEKAISKIWEFESFLIKEKFYQAYQLYLVRSGTYLTSQIA